MSRCCQTLKKSFSHLYDRDRAAIAANHMGLLDQRNWELSTPSASLPVLDVLMRSGTYVNGLEDASSRALSNMSACMTSSERSMLQKVSLFFGSSLKRSASEPRRLLDANSMSLKMYVEAHSGDLASVPKGTTFGASFFREMGIPYSLMMLDLLVSAHIRVDSRETAQLLMDRIQDNIAPDTEFSILVGTLSLLQREWEYFKVTENFAGGGNLFATCVRAIHGRMPSLTPEELMISYVLLDRRNIYTRPFIVMSELEKVLLCVLPEECTKTSFPVLLDFMRTYFVESRPTLWGQLCLSWYTDDRFTDMNLSQSCAALATVTRLHEKVSTEVSSLATCKDWQRLHDSLFAQLFTLASKLQLHECVALLESTELINISTMGITAPEAFVEKVKKRVFFEAKKSRRASAEEESLSLDDGTRVYYSLLRFDALVKRYTLVPFSTSEEAQLQELIFYFHDFCVD